MERRLTISLVIDKLDNLSGQVIGQGKGRCCTITLGNCLQQIIIANCVFVKAFVLQLIFDIEELFFFF